MEIQMADVLEIIQLLIVIWALFLIHKSVPAQQVAELIDRVDRQADKTKTPIDDLLVDVARLLNELRESNVPVVPTAEVEVAKANIVVREDAQ